MLRITDMPDMEYLVSIRAVSLGNSFPTPKDSRPMEYHRNYQRKLRERNIDAGLSAVGKPRKSSTNGRPSMHKFKPLLSRDHAAYQRAWRAMRNQGGRSE